MKDGKPFLKLNWPPTSWELEQREIERHLAAIPDDHAAVLISVRHPSWTPYVNEIAKDANVTFDHARVCLRNLKYNGLVRLTTLIREDREGYFGSMYQVTSMGRVVADKLERMGHPWPNGVALLRSKLLSE